jgi:hypothetical protein
MEIQNWRWKILSCLGLAFAFLLASHEARSQADFYKGKTITFIQATEPGGTGDLRARALVSSLQSTFPATRQSFPSTCQEAAGAKPPITCTKWRAPMGSPSLG